MALLAACDAPPAALGPDAPYVAATCALVAASVCDLRASCAGDVRPVELCVADEERACLHGLWALPVACQLANADVMRVCVLDQSVASCDEACPGGACARCGLVVGCD